MKRYIFYGAFNKENAMRRRAEAYIESQGDQLLFYVDDNEEKIGCEGYKGG